MITKAQQSELDTMDLERMVDEHGISAVVSMLATVCQEKAEHLISNWQDEQSAQWWMQRAATLEEIGSRPFMMDA